MPTLEEQIAAAEAEVEASHGSPKTGTRKKLKEAPPKKKTPPSKSSTTGSASPQVENLGWKRSLQTDKKGEYIGNTNNMRLILSHDPNWKGVLAYDYFIGDIVTQRLPPWPTDMRPVDFAVGDFSEKDTWRTKCWLEHNYGMGVKLSDVGGALQIVSDRVHVHPVRDYLESLRWDGKERIATWLSDLAGAHPTQYTSEVGKNFLIGAVARIFDPGCQVDSMPVFEGAQGAGKSTMVAILAGEWLYSSRLDINTKDAYQNLKRKWIVEMGELDSLHKADVSATKQFISQRTDTYRSSYARKAMDHPRQFVLVGTVNPEDGTGYLKDNTGARRFWPVPVGVLGPIQLDRIKKLRGQLFAEAVAAYKKGEKWHFTDLDVIKAAATATESRRQVDPWEEIVARWLKVNRSTSGDRKRGVSTHEILTTAFEMEISKINRGDEMRVAGALRMVGWTDVARETRTGITTRIYRPSAALLAVIAGGAPRIPGSGNGSSGGGNGSPGANSLKPLGSGLKVVSSTAHEASTGDPGSTDLPKTPRTEIPAKDISLPLDTSSKRGV